MNPWNLFTRTRLHRTGLICACAIGAVLAPLASASATIIYSTGNEQYYNVNIAADTDAAIVTGDIGNTGDQMTFNTMLGPQTFGGAAPGAVNMHCQHGVAFCESYADSLTNDHTGFSSLTLSAVGNTSWTAGDFALDLLGSIDGTVTFTAFLDGSAVNCAGAGCNQFAIDATGQNQFNFSFDLGGESIDQLVITMDCTSDTNCFNLSDIKQVSLQPLGAPPAPVPEPATLALFGAGFVVLGAFAQLRRRRGIVRLSA